MWHRFGDARREFLARLEAGEVLSWHVLCDAGMSSRYAVRTVRLWKDAQRIHVTRYERNVCGPPIPFYAAGPGEDAPRPKPRRARVRSRKWRQDNPDKVTDYQMRRKAKRLLENPPPLDPVTTALLGGRL
jgi:hypothetical protein